MVRGKTTHVWFAVAVLLGGLGVMTGLAGLGGCWNTAEPGYCCFNAAECEANGWSTRSECASNQTCSADNRCIDRDGACHGSDDCPAERSYCAPNGMCSSCEDPTDCAMGLPRCDLEVEMACVACASNDDCTRFDADHRVCDPTAGCVGCRVDATPSDCTDPNQPICDPTLRQCVACKRDADCGADGICVEDTGRCVPPDQIIFVATTGSDGETCSATCTQAEPCATLKCAITKLDPRTHIRIGPGFFDREQQIRIEDKTATIVGAGSDRTRLKSSLADGRSLFAIVGRAQVEIEGIRIGDSTGVAGHGVECDLDGADAPTLTLRGVHIGAVGVEGPNAGNGVDAEGCAVTIVQSTIRGNLGVGVAVRNRTLAVSQSTIIENAGGGISVQGATFQIRNNFLIGNGTASGARQTEFGGVRATGTTPASVLEFNTLSRNVATELFPGGVDCSGSGGGAVLTNNLVFDNPSTRSSQVRVTGCSFTSNLLNEIVTDNITTSQTPDQMFLTPGSNYHLEPTSNAVNAASMTATLASDFDGDVRPQPSNPRRDIGADEVRD